MASYYSQSALQPLQDETKTQTPSNGLSNTCLCPVPAIRNALLRTLYMQSLFRAFATEGIATYALPHPPLDMGHVAPRAPPQIRMRHISTFSPYFAAALPWIPAQTADSHPIPLSATIIQPPTSIYVAGPFFFVFVFAVAYYYLIGDIFHAFISTAHYASPSTSLLFHMERYLFSSIERMSPGGSWTVILTIWNKRRKKEKEDRDSSPLTSGTDLTSRIGVATLAKNETK